MAAMALDIVSVMRTHHQVMFMIPPLVRPILNAPPSPP